MDFALKYVIGDDRLKDRGNSGRLRSDKTGELAMKRIKIVITLFVYMLLLNLILCSGLFAEPTGTWKGKMDIPDAVKPVDLVMTIKNDNGNYTLQVQDSMGMIQDCSEADIILENNELKYCCFIPDGAGYLEKIEVALDIDGDTMTGYWEDEEGNSHKMKLNKVKLVNSS
jgi:hypothetical protein